jgi:hypothetical protein
MMHVQDQKANGTVGGASIAGDNDRDLNTTLVNEIAGATLINNEVTLAAGRYYIEADPSSGPCQSARSFVKDSLGNILLQSPNVHNNSTYYGGATVPVRGDITLLVETTIKVVTFSQVANLRGLGLETPDSTANTEVYTDLRIWQLDAIKTSPIIHDNKLYPLPGNTYVTGDMYGLEYSYTSANSITVDAGICYDSLNTTLLTGSASQVVTIGTTINQIYNLFLCDDGLVKTDTDVEGTTLLAGSVTALRWIGFVRNNSAGDICLFSMTHDSVNFGKASENIIWQMTSTTYTKYDHSALLPVARITEITYGADAVSQGEYILASTDAVNVAYFAVCSTITTSGDTELNAWQQSLAGMIGMQLFDGDMYFKGNLGNAVKVLCSAVKLRR